MSIRAKSPPFVCRCQSGLALVIVIWILTLLSLMAGSFAKSMRRETSVSFALKSNAEAAAQAESGLILAEFMLKQSDPEQRWQADGTIYSVLRPDGEIRVRIFAESGKVDINTSNEEQLTAVINAVTRDSWQQQRLLNAILDWRDDDDDTRTLGAEKKQYQQARLKYAPTNEAFQNLEELQLVLGMDEAIYNRIQPWITIYSGASEVNLHHASPELLAVLKNEMQQRNVHNASLEKRLNESADGNDAANESDESFTSEAQTYTIIVEALLHDEAVASLEAVVQSQGEDSEQPLFQVLDWKQDPQGLSLFDAAMESRIITVHDEFTNDNRP